MSIQKGLTYIQDFTDTKVNLYIIQFLSLNLL